jgi:epithelial splicing regulatory protein 1/2
MFYSSNDAQIALLTLNKKYMGNRYIELFDTAETDFAAVKSALAQSQLQKRYVVRLRGIPFSATENDVAAFLAGVALASDCNDPIVLGVTAAGRRTGDAHVELADDTAFELALTYH